MKKFLLIILFFLFANISLASDDKPGRFFEDQPDVNDDYQIHFNYLLAQDSEDRELDINGKMEKITSVKQFVKVDEKLYKEMKKKAAGHHLIFYSCFKYYHPEIIKCIESKI